MDGVLGLIAILLILPCAINIGMVSFQSQVIDIHTSESLSELNLANRSISDTLVRILTDF